jgi:multicomponent Na+:H+ antiporter subunit B
VTRPLRFALFFLSLAALIATLPAIEHGLPLFGAHPIPYGDLVNHIGPSERHVTNMVTAVNFDIRGFDTLGEEMMLLVAVTGTAVLLRGQRGELTELPATVTGREIPRRSEALTLAGRLFAPVVMVFGLYVVLHAQLTPGGGFQGGVIIASGLLLIYLGEGYGPWQRLMNQHLLDAMEGGGAAIYALAGFAPMVLGAAYLQNVLDLGKLGALLSGGLMLVLNWGVALAVTGGFGVLLMEFLQETRAEDQSEQEPEE